LPISGENIGVFLKKNNVMIKLFQKLALVLAKNANIFAKFFGENILKLQHRYQGDQGSML
jgi:hypothetical protein